MKIRTVAIFLVVAAVFAASAGFSQEKQEKKEKVLFIAPTFNIEGMGYTLDGLKEIGENLIKLVEKRTGLSFAYEMVGSTKLDQSEAMDLALKRLKEAGDFSWMDYRHYKEARRQGIPVKPVAFMTVNGKYVHRVCLYVDKDKPFKKLENLRDKKITGGHQLDWVGLRMLMFESGIDENPEKFFSDLIPVKTYNASFRGTIGGFIDTFVMPESVFGVVKNSFPASKSLIPLLCVEASHNNVFPVYRESVKPEVLEKFKEIIFNARNDPEMGMVAALMKQLNIGFIEVTPKIMDDFEASYQRAVKRGWFDEARKYNDKVAAMEKKGGDLKTCRKNCEKKKEDEKKICLDICEQKAK